MGWESMLLKFNFGNSDIFKYAYLHVAHVVFFHGGRGQPTIRQLGRVGGLTDIQWFHGSGTGIGQCLVSLIKRCIGHCVRPGFFEFSIGHRAGDDADWLQEDMLFLFNIEKDDMSFCSTGIHVF